LENSDAPESQPWERPFVPKSGHLCCSPSSSCQCSLESSLEFSPSRSRSPSPLPLPLPSLYFFPPQPRCLPRRRSLLHAASSSLPPGLCLLDTACHIRAPLAPFFAFAPNAPHCSPTRAGSWVNSGLGSSFFFFFFSLIRDDGFLLPRRCTTAAPPLVSLPLRLESLLPPRHVFFWLRPPFSFLFSFTDVSKGCFSQTGHDPEGGTLPPPHPRLGHGLGWLVIGATSSPLSRFVFLFSFIPFRFPVRFLFVFFRFLSFFSSFFFLSFSFVRFADRSPLLRLLPSLVRPRSPPVPRRVRSPRVHLGRWRRRRASCPTLLPTLVRPHSSDAFPCRPAYRPRSPAARFDRFERGPPRHPRPAHTLADRADRASHRPAVSRRAVRVRLPHPTPPHPTLTWGTGRAGSRLGRRRAPPLLVRVSFLFSFVCFADRSPPPSPPQAPPLPRSPPIPRRLRSPRAPHAPRSLATKEGVVSHPPLVGLFFWAFSTQADCSYP
jgi:hypothetical protein